MGQNSHRAQRAKRAPRRRLTRGSAILRAVRSTAKISTPAATRDHHAEPAIGDTRIANASPNDADSSTSVGVQSAAAMKDQIANRIPGNPSRPAVTYKVN